MRTICELAFWACAAGVIYAYAGYPLALYVLSRAFGRDPAAPVEQGELPVLSVLICAHNEAEVIAARIENALEMDYPRERLDIVIASDGSVDRTVEIARGYAERGVRTLDFADRSGKAETINSAFGYLQGEVVLLSDSNTFTQSDAGRMLVRWFADGSVGAVCGRLVVIDPAGGRNADGVYWRYETALKRWENRLGALLGANGAIYAIRRTAFAPLGPDTIVDDFVLPLAARIRTGCRIVYDPAAVAHEESAADVGSEFRRRARIGAGAYQAMGMLWPLLDPREGWVAFCFFSHKVLRWACPFLMLGALAGSMLLWRVPMFAAATLGQLAFYAGGVALGRSRAKIFKPLRAAAMLTDMNAALLVGFVRWLRGTQKATWTPTARSVRFEESSVIRQAA